MTNQQSRLIGTWRLTSWQVLVDGQPRASLLGEQPQGLLLYADDGFMSALMVATDRAPVDAPSLMATDDGHALAAARSCIAYSGRFEVIGDQVHHHVSQSLLPDWKGQTLVRTISWDGDLLVLSTPVEATPSGKRLVNKLSWSRPTDLM